PSTMRAMILGRLHARHFNAAKRPERGPERAASGSGIKRCHAETALAITNRPNVRTSLNYVAWNIGGCPVEEGLKVGRFLMRGPRRPTEIVPDIFLQVIGSDNSVKFRHVRRRRRPPLL